MSYGQKKPWSGMYMQRSTYGHDYTQQGISPRHRPGNMPYNASLKADIPAGSYRPHGYGAMDPSIRDIDGQRYESGPLTERRGPKKGEEWIGGRRYENAPQTDRGDYYMDRRRDISPERHRDISPGRYDRGRNGSPERYDRGRNGSPERFYDRDRNGYHDRFEKQYDVMDGYANRKFTDRTTYKDYGEFMQEKIKQDELRRNQLDYPTQDFQPALTGGVYLFIRTNKDALVEVRKALQESRTVLANSGGQLKGIAHADQITLLEGRPDGWMCRPSTQPGKDFDILNIVSVFWFESLHRAERWLHYESKFKTSSFPEPDGADVFAAPINFIPKEGDVDGTTYLMTEYREVRDVDQFREQFVAPMRRIFHNFGIQDFVMNTVGVKCFRGQWAKPRSIVTVNRFRDSEAAERFFFHPEYVRLRTQLKDMTRGRSSVLFNLVEKVV